MLLILKSPDPYYKEHHREPAQHPGLGQDVHQAAVVVRVNELVLRRPA